MGFNTFGPLLVVDAQLTPAAGVVGTVVDATTEATVATYDMSGNTISLVTNARGYVGQFQAPDTSVMLRLTFGDLALDVVAKEAIASGGGAVTSVDGKTGAVSLSSTYATKAELAAAGGAVVVDDTPAAPAEGTSATYFVTAAVSWPAGLEWSTDPDGDVAPTITGTALVSMFTVGGATRAIMGATFPALPAPADTTAPTWTATFTMGTPTETYVVATASALATDDTAVTGYEVSYNDGSTYAAITPSGSNFTLSGSAGTTYATTKLRAKDAAGNTSTALSVPSYTMAASTDTTDPTPGTLAGSLVTDTTFTLTVSGAADETALHATPYDFSLDNGATWEGYQAGATYNATGLTAGTAYTCKHRVRDAALNVSTGTAVVVTTEAAPASSILEDNFNTGDHLSDITGRVTPVGSVTWLAPNGAIGPFSATSAKLNTTYGKMTGTGPLSSGYNRIDTGVTDFTATFDYQLRDSGTADQPIIGARQPVGGGETGVFFRVRWSGSARQLMVMIDGTEYPIATGTFAEPPIAGTATMTVAGDQISFAIGAATYTTTYAAQPTQTQLVLGFYGSNTYESTLTGVDNLVVAAL